MSTESSFWQIFDIPEARWVVWITILAIAVLVGVYVVMYFRGLAFGRDESAADDLSEFRRLNQEGKLGDGEFAKLKSTIKNHQSLQPDENEEETQ